MSTVFEIGGKKYDVVKKGIGQAKQVADFGHWMANYGATALRNLNDGGESGPLGIVEIIGGVLGSLSADALIDLFITVFGCTKKEADEYFDISVLIDGLAELYNNQPAIKRMLSRFFSVTPSESTEQESSTPSE